MSDYGLIGHPIAHSLSPRLFEAAYGGRHGYDLIEGKYFEQSYSRFLRDYKAINVTAPFKEEAFEKADIISGPAALIGAANILVKTRRGVSAHNSDFSGVILSTAEALFPGIIEEFYGTFGAQAHVKAHQFVRARLEAKYGRRPSALVAGLGGAGKAAAVACAEMGFQTTVLNRTLSKAQAFAKGLHEYGFNVGGLDEFCDRAAQADLIIYALPLALEGIEKLADAEFSGEPVIVEANYRAPAFAGLTLARLLDRGAKYVPGKLWLTCQALSGYSLMTGEAPDAQALLSAI